MWILRIAPLVEAIFAAVLPHPTHVLDGIVVVRYTVMVNLRYADKESVPGGGHIMGDRDAGLGSYGRS